MSDYLSQILKSGKKLITDTKIPASKEKRETVAKSVAKAEAGGTVDTNPHKAFIKRVSSEKPKKDEVVKDLKRFIEQEEAKL